MLTALLAKLEREWLETDSNYPPEEMAWRRGWNARRDNLLGWLRTEMGLAELKASDVQ